MRKIYLFIQKRWSIFLIVSLAMSLIVFKFVEGKQLYYKAEARIVFIGKEGSFSPELQAKRIMEKDFLEKLTGELRGYSRDYIINNLEIDFEKYGTLSVIFVSEDPKVSKDIVNLVSNNFINERRNKIEELEKSKKEKLQLLSDDILALEAGLSLAEKNLRESKQENMESDQRRVELKAALAESNMAYQQLLKTFTEQHPDVITVKNRIDILDAQLRAAPDMSSEYERLEKIVAIEKSKLASRRSGYQQVYDQFQKQPSPWQAEIEKEAATPKGPLGINRQSYYLWGFSGSLIVAFLLCILTEIADDRIHASDEAESRLGVSVIADIGKVPIIKTSKKDMPGLAKKLMSNTRFSRAIKKIEQIYTFLKVDTFKGDMSNKSILITSSDSEIGKSFIAYNLALICVKNGEKVLLVDTNFYNPALGTIFNLNGNTPGLSDLLRGSIDQKESVRNMTDLLLSGTLKLKDKHIIGLDRLKLLLSGSKTENLFGLLGSGRIKELFKELAKDYGILIIDSAGIKQHPDALNLIPIVDSTLIVVRKHKSKYPALKEIIKKFENIKVHYMGMVFTDV